MADTTPKPGESSFQQEGAGQNQPQPMEKAKAGEEETTNNFDRIQLRRFNAVASWSWDIDTDNCAICRNLCVESCGFILFLFIGR